MKFKIRESKYIKACFSNEYNFIFNKKNGIFARWGKTKEDDPKFSISPEIADIEISTGKCLGGCKFCYKSNSGLKSNHMTLETYQKLINNIRKLLCQVALGITDCYANPDFFKILKWTREQDIIPNYTTHGLDVDDYVVEQTLKYCGAVAVSIVNKEKSYNAIKKFTDAGMSQVNIHFMISSETYEKAFEIIDDIKNDHRLKKLNAIVFLGLKKKGRAEDNFNYLRDQDKYNKLISLCEENEIKFGFDSCSSGSYFKYIENHKNCKELSNYVEPCESGLFSSYFNYKGEYFPCSFAEGTKGWEYGIDSINCKDFIKDVWFSSRVNKWRNSLFKSTESCICKFKDNCRSCPIFSDLAYCKDKKCIF